MEKYCSHICRFFYEDLYSSIDNERKMSKTARWRESKYWRRWARQSHTIIHHWKSWFLRLTDSVKWHRQTAKESKREISTKSWRRNEKIVTWKFQVDHQARFHDSQFLETVMITVIYKKTRKPDIYRSICIFSMFFIFILHFCTTDHTPSSAAAHSLTKLCLETIPDDGSSNYEQIYCFTSAE